jgi:isoleucyl-tRNA synthetase
MVVSQLMSPIAPFFSDYLYKSLTDNIREKAKKNNTPLRYESIHHTDWVPLENSRKDAELEKSMEYAQKICSLVHSIRKASKIKVRTPLSRILLPVVDEKFAARVKRTEDIIKAEVNVKGIEYIDDASGLLVKKVKPNFAKLGKQFGPRMKDVAAVITTFTPDDIKNIEKAGSLTKGEFNLTIEGVIISSEDIPGWSVANDGGVTVALDITVSEELKREGIARDFVNRIQNLRKDMGLEVLDKITIEIVNDKSANGHFDAIKEHQSFISNETQALGIEFKEKVDGAVPLDMDEWVMQVKVAVKK